MPPRSGNLIRPLLALDRQQIRAMLPDYIESAEDESNRDPSYARNRIRLEVIPALEKVNPAAELNISRSRAELQEDEDALAGIAADALARAGGPGPDGVPGRLLEGNPPAVQRRLLRLLAEAELGRPVSIGSSMATEAARLSRNPEGGRLDLGQGGFLLLEAGRIKVVDSEEPAVEPEPVPITAAKETIGFEGWEIASSRITEDQARAGFGDPLKAFFGADFAGLKLRRWHFGDRIEPLGMSGSKSLQDVFTDRRVPASRRRRWPVLTAGETVVWLPGLVRSRHLLVGESGRPVLRLHARPPFAI